MVVKVRVDIDCVTSISIEHGTFKPNFKCFAREREIWPSLLHRPQIQANTEWDGDVKM